MKQYVDFVFRGAVVSSLLLVAACGAVPSGAPVAETRQRVATTSFPLKIAANGRYLVDQNNQPFRINADAAWFLSTNASSSDVDAYLADRSSKGFNSFILMAMVHPGGYGSRAPNAPNNLAGQGPFSTPGDFSTPNGAYWSFIDSIIDKAAARGMVVILAYQYLGYSGGAEGWWSEVNQANNTQTVMYNYGVWLGNRYRSRPNILWYACGDYTPPTGSEGSARVRKTIDGIRSVIPGALFGAEMSPPDTVPSDVSDFTNVLNMNSFYGAGPNFSSQTFFAADHAWQASGPRPAWVGEPGYEGVALAGMTGSPGDVRKAEYWSVLAGGIAGQNFGVEGVWDWQSGWASALNSTGSFDMQRQFALYASLPWYQLVPSGTAAGYVGKNLITNGQSNDGNHIAAAATAAGTWLLAYVPPTGNTARSFDVDMSAMNGATRARWFNPTSGAYTTVGSSLPNTGTRTFTTPGDNGTGLNDWVLVLDANGVAAKQNQAPTVATAAASNPTRVTGKSSTLSVLGADDGGESNLTYNWTTQGSAPAQVIFSDNGTNTAKQTVANFSKAGAYTFQVTITDSQGASATSSVAVSVDATATDVLLTPLSAAIPPDGTAQFTATERDQFRNALATQPSFGWALNGGGTVNGSGLVTAGSSSGGPYTLSATGGGFTGTAGVTVTTASSSVVIGSNSVYSIDDWGNGNLLIAQKVNLSQPATLQSLSFYVATAAGKLRLGIYDASGSGGRPGAKKAETSEITPVVGWNSANVTSPISLPAGDYWLAYLPSSSSLHFRRAGFGTCVYYSYSYGAMPARFSSSVTAINDQWSFYGTLSL